MAGVPMDPQVEQRLRDEVIYLHSLWHQGPRTLGLSKTTPFKRGGGGRDIREKKMGKDIPNTSAASATEWPCPTPPPPASDQRWPSPHLETKATAADARALSPEEQMMLASIRCHRSAQKVVNEFFNSDATDSDSDSDDELIVGDDYQHEHHYSNIFFKVFDESLELRAFYKKTFVDGEFTCLVCGALGGKKKSKKYRGCLALVQHSITLSKTKKRKAHRALGQAICKVLGWDIDQLPSIVSLLSDKSYQAQVNVSAAKGGSVEVVVDNVDSVEPEGDKLYSKDGDDVVIDRVASVEDDKLVALKGGSSDAGVLHNGDELNMVSLNCPDVGKKLDDPSTVHPPCMKIIPSSEEWTGACNSFTCPYVDREAENNDQNSENYSLHPDSMEVPAADGLTSSSLAPIRIPGVGNECRNW